VCSGKNVAREEHPFHLRSSWISLKVRVFLKQDLLDVFVLTPRFLTKILTTPKLFASCLGLFSTILALSTAEICDAA